MARLLVLADAAILHVPALLMLGSLALVVLLAARQARLACVEGTILLLAYPVFIAWYCWLERAALCAPAF